MSTANTAQPAPQDALRAAIFMPYADPKSGKTTLLARAFPRALFIGRRDAIQPVCESSCGFTPHPWQFIESVTTLQQLVWFLSDKDTGLRSPNWQAAIKAHQINALVVDDVSQMCAKSVIIWRGEAKQGDKYYHYNQLDVHLDWVSFLLADTGLLCGLSAHVAEPKYERNDKSPNYGNLIAPGAPEVPSSKQVQAMPGWAGLVAPVRSVAASVSRDPWWPKVLSVNPADAGTWVSGDRNNVCWAETPANLREVLNAAPTPYHLPRLPGCEWQDEYAESVCTALLSGEPVLSIVERMFAHLKVQANTPGELLAQWAVQDGIARAVIRERKQLGVLGRLRAASATSVAPPPPPPASK